MTNKQISEMVRDIVGVKKGLIGIKVWKEEPKGIRKYEGKAFPGMCAQIGEVLSTGETFVTDRKNQFCTGGIVATALHPLLQVTQATRSQKCTFR